MLAKRTTTFVMIDSETLKQRPPETACLSVTHYCEPFELIDRVNAACSQYVKQHPEAAQLKLFDLLREIPAPYFTQQTLSDVSIVLVYPIVLANLPFSETVGPLEMAKTIPLTAVESSNIEAIGYANDTLRVRFKGNPAKSYDYTNVAPDVYNAFLASSSKGQYFRTFIQSKYASVVVADPA